MSITSKQKKFLRGLAHSLKPVAFLGKNGATPEVLKEIERGLNDHELIKVQIACGDQDEFIAFCEAITTQLQAVVVQKIGHMLILYRALPEPKIRFPGSRPAVKKAATISLRARSF